MSPGILGKKIGMTQVFNEDGQVVPVTLVKAGPCIVTQRKTPATDGYDAVQLGLVEYAKKAEQAGRRTLEEIGRRRREVSCGSFASGTRGQRRFEAGRSRAGRRVQAERTGGCGRNQQRPRVRGSGEAAPFPRRSGDARIDVSSRCRVRSAPRAFRRACFRA